MKCPSCDDHFEPEDYDEDDPFGCPLCGEMVRIVTDEGGYRGASEKRLVLWEED
ncbi:MAG: hypothetical protein U9R74_08975 [Pseudomonadota bacterium]|nr:hypothetical protein [Pseudomonadota bacterium]